MKYEDQGVTCTFNNLDLRSKDEWHVFNVYITEAKNYEFSVDYVYKKWQHTKTPHKSEPKLKSL